ncbi:hypothetical protein ACFQDL_20460 [Marinobacterium aestuariivivens]|uniref:Uncharacterized protein n=1 Tax=Marinobacterium aestuariivivens TaxID=1698799 RepID=A0ABW2A3T7_9GAMM
MGNLVTLFEPNRVFRVKTRAAVSVLQRFSVFEAIAVMFCLQTGSPAIGTPEYTVLIDKTFSKPVRHLLVSR